MKVDGYRILELLECGEVCQGCVVPQHHFRDGHTGKGHPAAHHTGAQGYSQGAEELRQTVVLVLTLLKHAHP